jgi:hypothetical protein
MSRWAAVALVISVAVLTACTVVGLLIQVGWITNV